MFRRIVGTGINGWEDRALKLFQLHPVEINALLELAWETRFVDTGDLGKTNNRSNLSQLPAYFIDALFDTTKGNKFPTTNRYLFPNISRWDHLIYSYLIENTCAYKIFRQVVFEFLHGEKFGVPTDESHSWLRNTEELFYSNPAPYTIYNVVSHIRPDTEATRRNSYFRMFGIDLNHGAADNKPYPFLKPESSNRDFVSTFEDFLQEVWTGMVNAQNQTGAKSTDDAAIFNLITQMRDMLLARRSSGNLSREEFFFVTMMSWFHLTLEFKESPILQSLRATGEREDQRLFSIANRVGIPAHAKSYDFFQLAEPMSRILLLIETGVFNVDNVKELYTPSVSNEIVKDMRIIISHWGLATGRDMKVRRGENISVVTNTYRGYTSAQIPGSNSGIAASSNGREKPATV